MIEPLVSVLIPTFDRVAYLQQAVSSALAQTHTALEIIVCDDCGPRELGPLLPSDGRLQIRRNDRNVGVVQNVLGGLAAAKGAFLAILNDDDYWDPSFVARMVQRIDASEQTVVAFSDHFVVDAAGVIDISRSNRNSHRWGRSQLSAGVHRPFIDLALLHRTVPAVQSALFRSGSIDTREFPVEVGGAYDLWIAYLACRDGLGATYDPARLTYKRIHAGMETNLGRVRHARGAVFCYQRFVDDERLREWSEPLAGRLRHAQLALAFASLEVGDHRGVTYSFRRGDLGHNARNLLLQALRKLPPRVAAAIARLIRQVRRTTSTTY